MLALEAYLSENVPNSNRVLSHIKEIKSLYGSRLKVSINYVNRTPEQAINDGIFITPMVIIRNNDRIAVLAGAQSLEKIDEMIKKICTCTKLNKEEA